MLSKDRFTARHGVGNGNVSENGPEHQIPGRRFSQSTAPAPTPSDSTGAAPTPFAFNNAPPVTYAAVDNSLVQDRQPPAPVDDRRPAAAAATESQQGKVNKEPPPPSRRSYAAAHVGPQPLPIHPAPILTPRQHGDLNPDLPYSVGVKVLDEHGHLHPASRPSGVGPPAGRLTDRHASMHDPERDPSKDFGRFSSFGRHPAERVRGNSSISIGDRISMGKRASAAAAAAADGYSMAEHPEERGVPGSVTPSSRRSFDYANNSQRMGGRSPEQIPACLLDSGAVLRQPAHWRHGQPPEFKAATRKYDKERLCFFAPGSTAEMVTNLIKNFEREASHKVQAQEWVTVDLQAFRYCSNAGRLYTAEELGSVGTVHAMLGEPAFRSALLNMTANAGHVWEAGLVWELIELYSGPPTIAFKWRYWGDILGTYGRVQVEQFGLTVVRVDPHWRLTRMERECVG
ncbi:hypothetical protein WJX73_004653 [Symbiochloris irregularis]|uniref:Uncharacterized protein n=1 Tax=Symbiochloris irregularis TaxID=706552 RepID=A0AAW1NGM8_9CHLO